MTIKNKDKKKKKKKKPNNYLLYIFPILRKQTKIWSILIPQFLL
jgi:hypothetical protein